MNLLVFSSTVVFVPWSDLVAIEELSFAVLVSVFDGSCLIEAVESPLAVLLLFDEPWQAINETTAHNANVEKIVVVFI